MAFKVLDHSTALADPVGFARAAKAAGFDAVMRYLLLPPGTLMGDSVGRLTLEERIACHAEGLGVGIIYERDTVNYHRPLSGASGGLIDGPAARAAATSLGFAPDFPIFGAADFNPTPDQYPTIDAYFQAAGFEPYANGPLLTYLAARGYVHSWMHNWGGSGYGDPHLHQQGGQITIAGVNCDLNDGYYEDCIWWPPSSVHIQSVGPAQPIEEEVMLSFVHPYDGPWKGYQYRTDPSGAVYVFDASGHPDGNAQTYFGGLNTHVADWHAGAGQANGPPFMFGPLPDGNCYYFVTRDDAGALHYYGPFGPKPGAVHS